VQQGLGAHPRLTRIAAARLPTSETGGFTLDKVTIMSRFAMKAVDAGGARELTGISMGVSIAAIEFVVCGAVLMALAAFGVVSIAAAATWAALILVPLSATIGVLGIRVNILSRRVAPRNAVTAPRKTQAA
jgi:hypothetical protein